MFKIFNCKKFKIYIRNKRRIQSQNLSFCQANIYREFFFPILTVYFLWAYQQAVNAKKRKIVSTSYYFIDTTYLLFRLLDFCGKFPIFGSSQFALFHDFNSQKPFARYCCAKTIAKCGQIFAPFFNHIIFKFGFRISICYLVK